MSIVHRSNDVDVIKMAALIGICVVNVPFMGLPLESVLTPPTGFYDQLADFVVKVFLQLKFFLLFSFIFGWGMAIQSASAESKGQSFSKRYFRRMAGLAFLGIIHALLVFSGDILVLYALLGMLLWWIKDFSPRNLIKFAAWMLPLSMIFLTIIAVMIGAVMADPSISLFATDSAQLGGGFLDATQARVTHWPFTFGFLVFLQGPLALSAFAVGLAAAKTDFFSENSVGFNLLRRRVPLLIVIALPLNILYAAVSSGIVPEPHEMLSLLSFVFIAIGAPALSLIYLYMFICLSRRVNMPYLLVLAGQNSLSSYVTQGVLAGFVFGAYGLGVFDSLGHAALLPVSLLIALAAMIFVGGWAKIFGRGPLEPILRKMSGT